MQVYLGADKPLFILYVPRHIPYKDLEKLEQTRALNPLELSEVLSACSNDWRKICSTFSKVLCKTLSYSGTWQEYMETVFLQKHGNECMVFSSSLLQIPSAVHVIGGKAFAQSFDFGTRIFSPISDENKLLRSGRIFLTPYLDYRQFPNVLIDCLVTELKKIY